MAERPRRWPVAAGLGLLLLGYAAIAALLYARQDALVYYPTHTRKTVKKLRAAPAPSPPAS